MCASYSQYWVLHRRAHVWPETPVCRSTRKRDILRRGTTLSRTSERATGDYEGGVGTDDFT
jgi:hypothetical protein